MVLETEARSCKYKVKVIGLKIAVIYCALCLCERVQEQRSKFVYVSIQQDNLDLNRITSGKRVVHVLMWNFLNLCEVK